MLVVTVKLEVRGEGGGLISVGTESILDSSSGSKDETEGSDPPLVLVD